MKQYLHQLQNTTLGIPTELWVSSTDKIKPGTSDLFSAGLFWKPNGKYNFSAETFYTSLHNVIRYKDGTTALKERGDSWEDYVVSGKGEFIRTGIDGRKNNRQPDRVDCLHAFEKYTAI